jgi:uncharacterized membrane protein
MGFNGIIKVGGKSARRKVQVYGLRAIIVVALAGLGLTGYMAGVSVQGGVVAGCGAASGCDQALNSAWSHWLGVPVSLLAALVYLAVLLCAMQAMWMQGGRAERWAWTGMLALGSMLFGGAVWFVYLLEFHVKAICGYCVAAHLLGVVTAVLVAVRVLQLRSGSAGSDRRLVGRAQQCVAVVAAAVGIAVLIAGQMFWPARTYAVVDVSEVAGQSKVVGEDGAGHAEDHEMAGKLGSLPPMGRFYGELNGRRVVAPEFSDVVLEPGVVPTLGRGDATHLVVLLGDYTCNHCQAMHNLLRLVQRRYGDQIGIIVVNCPISSRCNPAMEGRGLDRPGACEYAKLALALWRSVPSTFTEFEDWVLGFEEAPPLDIGVKKVMELAGREKLEAALADPWVGEQLKRNVELAVPLIKHFRTLPIVLIEGKMITGVPATPQEMYAILEQQLQLKAPAVSGSH